MCGGLSTARWVSIHDQQSTQLCYEAQAYRSRWYDTRGHHINGDEDGGVKKAKFNLEFRFLFGL